MKLKLFTAFLLAISALALVGYISYEGLNHLMNTLIATSKPDQRVEQFRKLNHLITEAENSVRIYTITKDRSYLKEFYQTSRTIENHLKTLDSISSQDAFLAQEIDSVSTLVHNKISLQNQLIHLKRQQTRTDVYQKVIQEIESLESKPPKIDTIEEKIEKKGFLRKIFGSKEETKVTIDTVAQKEDISKKIDSTLTKYEKEEEQREKYLTYRELSLTRQDKAITDKIVAEIDKIEKHFEKATQNKAEAASETLDHTKEIIIIIGSTSAVLILFLIFIILNDYQVIQQNRKKLELAKQKAEHLAKAKDEFLSNMSHEIRTPLNAVIGFTEQLGHTTTNENQKKYINIIHDASQHLLAIINDILDYSKIEAGKIKFEKIPVDIKQCMTTVCESLKPKALEKNLQFTYSVDGSFDKQGIIGDPVRLKQILFNLIINAIKFTEAGDVKCTVTQERKYNKTELKIVISDTGIGIDPTQKNKIFQKFDQADSSTTRKYGGTGLGLSIVKQLVRLHRGKIDVDSELNVGTTFTITIPVKLVDLQEEDAQEGINQLENNIDLSDTKILLADDEDYNLMLLENILNKYNAQTKSVHTGHEVIEALKDDNYDLLMLDLQMPKLDGISTAKKIRKSGLKIPIIAITAAVTPLKASQCKVAGIDEIIVKPTPEKSLVNVFVKFLGLKKSLSELSIANETNEHTTNGNGIDFHHLNKLIESDDFINQDMISLYANNLKQTRNTLNESFKAKDYEQIKLSAHKILPSTRHMGLNHLVINLQTLENLAESPNDTKKISEELEHFNNLASETLSTIENYLEYSGQ